VIDELRARKFAYGELHALDDERNVGRPPADDEEGQGEGRLAVRSRPSISQAWIWPSFAAVRLLAERYAEAAAAHAWVIDGSAAFRARADVPLVVADVNPAVLAGSASRGLIALPGSASVALATALAPLHALAELKRVEVATYQAVSGSGRAAMDELAGETVAMLSGKKARGALSGGRSPSTSSRRSMPGRGRGVARGARLWEETRRCSIAAARHQRHGGAGAGVLRPQPRGARGLRAAHDRGEARAVLQRGKRHQRHRPRVSARIPDAGHLGHGPG
jgi:hypothetical protein